VTLDDVCEVGMTSNAVVIYDLQRGTSVAWGLDTFLPDDYRETLHRSVSNIDWRGDVYVDNWAQTVYVAPPTNSKGAGGSIVIDLAKATISFELRKDE
jgi:hypothetical protein